MKIEDFYSDITDCYVRVVKKDNEVIGLISFDFGHGLHFYDIEMNEVEYRSIGDFAVDNTDIDTARYEMEKWAEELKTDEFLF